MSKSCPNCNHGPEEVIQIASKETHGNDGFFCQNCFETFYEEPEAA